MPVRLRQPACIPATRGLLPGDSGRAKITLLSSQNACSMTDRHEGSRTHLLVLPSESNWI